MAHRPGVILKGVGCEVLINLYLPSTADSARIAFLKLLLPHLKLLPTHTAVYLGGDFNFTTNPLEDNSGPVGHPTSPKLIKYWDRITETLGLRELPQTSHTYYHLSANKYSSSRLDRFYIALNESAITSFTPRCRVTRLPPKPIHSSISFSGHVPIALDFLPPPVHRTSKSTPLWAIRHAHFRTYFDRLYKPSILHLPSTPLQLLSYLKDSIARAARMVMSPR